MNHSVVTNQQTISLTQTASLHGSVFIPTHMLFGLTLPVTVHISLLQLYALVRGGQNGRAFSLQELISVTGKSRRTLSRHLLRLISAGYIVVQTHKDGKISISFPTTTVRLTPGKPNHYRCSLVESLHSNHIEPSPYFPDRIMGYLSYAKDDEP